MEQHSTSLYINMLPTAVQARLPAISAIHNSIKISGLIPQISTPLWRSAPNSPKSEPMSASFPDPEPVSDLQLLGSSRGTQDASELTPRIRATVEAAIASAQASQDFASGRNGTTAKELRASLWKRSAASTTSGIPESTLSSDTSGINWRYATQGAQMHDAGRRESSLEHGDPDLARRAYVDGLAYLLRALPDDLDEQEIDVIYRSMPDSRSSSQYSHGQVYPQVKHQKQQRRHHRLRVNPEEQSALLRRGIQRLVAQLVFLVHMVLCLVSVLARAAAQYERDNEWKVSRQLVGGLLAVADGAGHVGAAVGLRLRDGYAGRLASWAVESIVAGVRDGVGEGLEMVGGRGEEAWGL